MGELLKAAVRKGLLSLGYRVTRVRAGDSFPPDVDESCRALWQSVQPFTMTSIERIHALRESVRYVVKNDIPGSIVECGVWKGGSMMAAARTLMELDARRKLYLFDTFEGMSQPTAVDVDFHGVPASVCMAEAPKVSYSPLDEVAANLRSTGYDESLVTFVKGKVEDTLPEAAPDQIALLRLDTDWYESTYHELVHLYPRLVKGGVLIIDDYGHYEGAKLAVTRYFEEIHAPVLLNRIDYTGRLVVKPG